MRAGSGVYMFAVRGDAARLSLLLASPTISDHHRRVLRSLHASMDSHDVSRFERHYPSSTPTVRGGRATFRDVHGKGNVLLTCSPVARAFIYGAYYDEIDISRSHFSSLLGCHRLHGHTRPITMTRYADEAAVLEAALLGNISEAARLGNRLRPRTSVRTSVRT